MKQAVTHTERVVSTLVQYRAGGALESQPAASAWCRPDDLGACEDRLHVPCQQHLRCVLGVVHRDDELGPEPSLARSSRTAGTWGVTLTAPTEMVTSR